MRGVRTSVHPLPDSGHDSLYMVCIEWIQPRSARAIADNDGVTEGVLMDTEQALSMLQALDDFGLQISIDDFGTASVRSPTSSAFPFTS